MKRALQQFNAHSYSPDEDIDWHNNTLRQRSRILYTSSPVASSAINTVRTKAAGIGLSLQSSIDRDILGLTRDQAKAWQKRTEREFDIWARKKQNCDALGLNNFYELQQLAVKSWLMSGDVFALVQRYEPTPTAPYSLRLHLIEADRVCTPFAYAGSYGGITTGKVPEDREGAGHKIYDGVEVDERGLIAAYYIASDYPNKVLAKNIEYTRIPAYGDKTGLPNILHLMESERPESYRGVPYIAHDIEPLLQLRRYTEASLMGAIVQCLFTAWVITESPTGNIPFNVAQSDVIRDRETGLVGASAPAGAQNIDADYGDDDDEDTNDYDMGPGTVTHLGKGESIVFGNPNIPTASFNDFLKAIIRLVGGDTELTYDVLSKEFNSSYSAARAALQEAWEAIRMRRTWFVDDFCQPVYELWLTEAVARGRIKAPGFFTDPLVHDAWCKAQWIGPVPTSLDPLKEANADDVRIRSGVKTREQVIREQGGTDFDDVAEQLQYEQEIMQKINGTTGGGESAEQGN